MTTFGDSKIRSLLEKAFDATLNRMPLNKFRIYIMELWEREEYSAAIVVSSNGYLIQSKKGFLYFSLGRNEDLILQWTQPEPELNMMQEHNSYFLENSVNQIISLSLHFSEIEGIEQLF